MARGRRKKQVEESTVTSTVNITTPQLPESALEVKLPETSVTEIKQEEKPAAIIEDKKESEEVKLVEKQEAKKPEEPVTSEEFVSDLPKIDQATEVTLDQTTKRSVTVKRATHIFSKPVVSNNKKVIVKSIEYPPQTAAVIAKLRKNPAYQYLTDAAILRIAASTLRRSKYFLAK